MAETAQLPNWDLSHLYDSPEDKQLGADLDAAASRAKAFSNAYAGKLADMDGLAFAKTIGEYESILDGLYKAMSYGQLLFSVSTSDAEIGRFYQTLQERVTDISADTLFFTLEINRLDDEALAAKMSCPQALRYQPWLDKIRQYRDHQLSDDMEKLLLEKSVTGHAAWVRLFEETFADMRFDVDGVGEGLTQSQVMNLLSDKDGAKRKAAAMSFGKVLGDNVRLLALITNTLAKDKDIEDRWRGYARPVSERNMSNQVEDDVVDALVSSVRGEFKNLSHRYYALKAKWFGKEVLDYWDRNAPLPDDASAAFEWDDAKALVLDAYNGFEPRMADVAERFFAENWIDAQPREGKDSGAFAHPVVPSAHPYILLNFHGKPRDVMTLAHELGHGVHQVLAADQGGLMADTPLTTAETASVFGEMLTFRKMVDNETDPAKRRILLAGKVEDMLNTVVRQIAFHEFERRVHDERKSGEISVERLGDIWIEVQSESLGPAIRFDDAYRNYWAYIPHFVHTPFYVYAYAFGDCLVNSLYDVFANGAEKGFQQRYLDMLAAGGTKRHKELLAPFGLDASDPEFWKRGLGVVSGFIDELEAVS
ncbi:M3 family oligoendopeptidase [Magnetovibrio blakemorei]|uniref:Oligoendopeptidase F n=1 Tax=Magnetovibrio blakemorei TaxID=28181 RepID=A0A1E5Q9U4_9PROT|nr:M3 family oligoendopeptidase [Magnetovibrio blakemorei]OEJ68492.1 oligoendopeptidase F [Magnetovibrio blakemorei]